MEEAAQAIVAVSSLCDDAMKEASKLMLNFRPSSRKTEDEEKSALPSDSPSLTVTTTSYYDPKFTTRKGRVFYSKDKKSKLIAFEKDSHLLTSSKSGSLQASSGWTSATSISSDLSVISSTVEQCIQHNQLFHHNNIVYKIQVEALLEKDKLKELKLNGMKAKL